MGIIDFLVLNEANVNLNNEGCDSPLILAARKHYSEIVRKILNASPNLFHCGKENLNAIETCFSYPPILNLATAKEVINGTFANSMYFYILIFSLTHFYLPVSVPINDFVMNL